MCGTATEVVPVKSVDGMPVGNGSRGPITAALQQAFFGIFDGSTEIPDEWLDSVEK
jgi:branched-chain amino acid aminotransferase